MKTDTALTPTQQYMIWQAISNNRLEGYEPSEKCKHDLEKIARGEITVEQSIQETLNKYKDACNSP